MESIANGGFETRQQQLERFSEGVAVPNETDEPQASRFADLTTRQRAPELDQNKSKRRRYTWTESRHKHYEAFRRVLEIQDDKWADVQRQNLHCPISREAVKEISWDFEENRQVLDFVYGEIEAGANLSVTAAAYKRAWYELVSFCDSHKRVIDGAIYEKLRDMQIKGTPLHSWFQHGLHPYGYVFDKMKQMNAPAAAMRQSVIRENFDTNDMDDGEGFSWEISPSGRENPFERALTREEPSERKANATTKVGHSWKINQKNEFDAFGKEFKKIAVPVAWKHFVERYPTRPKDLEGIDR